MMTSPTDDLRLRPDAQARFRVVVAENFDFIWRSLRGLGVPSADADDATQQVFLVAARKLDAIDPGSERSFLFSTARGVAANARRAQLRRKEDPGDDSLASREDRSPNPEELASAAEAREILERLLSRLPDEMRTVFVLFELEGMATPAIAELLGLPAGTVASRLRRARESFQLASRRIHAGAP